MSEQTMTASEALHRFDLLIDAHHELCPCPIVEHAREARAAVAELVSEVERVKESNTALTDEVMDRDIENARLRDERDAIAKRLNAEENAHAELQARCFDNGQPSFGSIFDERDALRRRVEELERQLNEPRFTGVVKI